MDQDEIVVSRAPLNAVCTEGVWKKSRSPQTQTHTGLHGTGPIPGTAWLEEAAEPHTENRTDHVLQKPDILTSYGQWIVTLTGDGS